jgi:hypothetical protein
VLSFSWCRESCRCGCWWCCWGRNERIMILFLLYQGALLGRLLFDCIRLCVWFQSWNSMFFFMWRSHS